MEVVINYQRWHEHIEEKDGGQKQRCQARKARQVAPVYGSVRFSTAKADISNATIFRGAIDALEEELRGGPRSDEDEVVIPRRRVFSDKREELLLREAISVLLERKPGQPWRYASRETLIKDLKALGIRSKLRKQRPG